MPTYNILVIDDDATIRQVIGDVLSENSAYNVLLAADGRQAVRLFSEQPIDVVLTDIHMPDFSGLEVLADMQKIRIKPEILVMTSDDSPASAEKAREIGARSLLLKPFDNLEVLEAEVAKAVDAVREAAAATQQGSEEDS